jgi:hypothetical protein
MLTVLFFITMAALKDTPIGTFLAASWCCSRRSRWSAGQLRSTRAKRSKTKNVIVSFVTIIR